MGERLIISGFAGIKELTLDIGGLNMIIGPQAAGKSICAKLLFYFKSFLSEMIVIVRNNQKKWDLDSRMISKFEKYFPPSSWPSSGFSIRYEVGNTFFQIDRAGTRRSKLKLQYSEYYSIKLRECRTHFRKILAKESEKHSIDKYDASFEAQKKLMSAMHNEIGKTVGFHQIFIPAGRSFFANLQSSIFSFLSSNEALDPFLVEFGSVYESVKGYPGRILRRREKNIELANHVAGLAQLILHGEHVREKGKDVLVLEDGRRVNLENASSGQQEMLPLAIMLSLLPFSRFIGGGATVYIEEPEAHLFPTAQRHIVELIATVYNSKQDALQFVITTHSPYILTAFNNLLQAGSLAENVQGKKIDALNSIVPKFHQLSPKFMKSYALKGGTQHNLICSDSGLISADIIDEVSHALSVQFGNLLEVE